jgi:glucokinase
LSPIFYITIGSGIGGGLIINGEIYRGCGRGAAEIGHTRHAMAMTIEGGGRALILEQISSGWAIANKTKNVVWKGPDGSWWGPGKNSQLVQNLAGSNAEVTASDVAEAARCGDDTARSILDFAFTCLAEAVSNVIALLCPRRIIIGGGVSLMGDDLFFKPLREKIGEIVFAPFAGCYDIVPAALGEEVVVHGALALARKRLSE